MYPVEWEVIQGRDYVKNAKSEIVDGPFGSNLKASEYQNSGVPILRIQNIKRLKFLDKNIRFVTKEKAEFLSRHSYKPGDILVTKLGDPLGLACIVPNYFEAGVIVADLVRIRPDEGMCSKKFLVYLINSDTVIKQISEHVKGTTRPRINLSVIRDLDLPLPPLAEQKEIARRLDDLLAQVDTLKARLDNIPAILKSFRQSVLAAAVSGKLTEEWRKENGRTLQEKSISEFSELVTKGASPKWQGINYVEDPSQTLFVTSENVGTMELLLDKSKYVEDEFNTKQKRSILQKGDVLTNIVGASIGRAAVWKKNLKANTNQAVCIIRLKLDQCLSDFLCYYLNSPIGIDQLIGNKVEVARANVSLTNIKSLKLILPSLEEQIEIVRRVEQLFDFADKIEEKLKNAQSRVDKLTQSILKKAFQGDLTAEWREQNPNLISGENSAEALLKRIKAEREKLKEEGRKKKKPKSKSMPKLTRELVVKTIETIEAESFSFNDIREKLKADYEQLKEIVFELLSEAHSEIEQYFDTEKETILLRKK